MGKNILIIGHPLAAVENRGPFQNQLEFTCHLIIPEIWNSFSAGHKFFNSTSNQNTSAKNCKLYFLKTYFNGQNTFFLWKNLHHQIQQIKPEIIYCWAEPWCLSTLQVAYSNRNTNIPLIFYSAENKVKNLPWPFKYIQKKVFQKYTACITPTLEIKSRICTSGFSKNVYVIPLPIPARQSLTMNSSHKKLAYIGRLIPLKQVDLIIKALPLLSSFTLDIIGDGPELAELKSLASQLKVENKVFFKGYVVNHQLGEYLHNISLLILPTAENSTQAEQFGKAALEAASLGIPVLVNSTGNLRKLAEKLPTIYSVPLNNKEQMALAIQTVFDNYPISMTLENTRKQIHEEYGCEKITSLFNAMINDLLKPISALSKAYD